MADQATRRLGASEPGCPKCGASQVWAEAHAYGYNIIVSRIVGTGRILGLPKRSGSNCRALTCPACGYTEFYTSEPEKMRERD